MVCAIDSRELLYLASGIVTRIFLPVASSQSWHSVLSFRGPAQEVVLEGLGAENGDVCSPGVLLRPRKGAIAVSLGVAYMTS